MSNKETLQQNNLRLNENNTDLTSILNKINTLPSVTIPEELNITSSTEQQSYEGLYNKVNVAPISTEGTFIMPSTETQVKEGLFSTVTVAGDSNLVAENIKEGVTIFGVEGEAEIKGEENAVVNTVLVEDTSLSSEYRIFNSNIIELPTLDVTNLSTMKDLFNSFSKIKSINLINKTDIISLSQAFKNCYEVIEINFTNTVYTNNLGSTFKNCKLLKKIPQINTENNLSYYETFFNCSKLKEIFQLEGALIQSLYNTFGWCDNLETFGGIKNLGKAYKQKTNNYSNYKLGLSYCKNLTYESLMNVINNLYDLNLTYDVANGGTLYTQQLVLGSTNMAKLTSEEIAIATSKGWVVS